MAELKHRRKGRGAIGNTSGRYEAFAREAFDDGWGAIDETPAELKTQTYVDTSRTIISHNQSPDIPFDQSINPYRGCEHGCVYCYARPTHAWLGLSPALDFESRLFYKPEGATLLRKELAAPNYRCTAITLGANTDAYQPLERRLQLTRQILEVLAEHRHPLRIVTKSALVERDLDLLAALANERLCAVSISVTTLDRALARRMEPRAAAPERRLRAIETLAAAGVPVSIFVAPVIPALTDSEMEKILKSARAAGARSASYTLLRLPLEISGLFKDWLAEHYPLKAEHVMARVRDMRGGKDYDATFGERMRGTGEFAKLLGERFALATRRLGFVQEPTLDCSQFRRPSGEQLRLL